MAARHLPNPHPLPVAVVNAATDNPMLQPSQPIEWQNLTLEDIWITVNPNSTGFNPLTQVKFKVPAMSGGSVGTHPNAVTANCPAGTYSFTRSATQGDGKIIITSGV